MTDGEISYKGADAETLMEVARQAVAMLCSIKPEDVKVDEDGDILTMADSAGVYVGVRTDPSALVFRAFLLDGVKESPALYALLNEINLDLDLGQVYYYEESNAIRYYYKYFAESPTPELVAFIITTMNDIADLYDDRLKTRLGGERFNEVADDEVDV
ncbi:MAG: YbjN domain-containing protein [Cyanobacteriota bacterium]|nr:YbjN domain-containing protein [Cyanobacteriota bacterium]